MFQLILQLSIFMLLISCSSRHYLQDHQQKSMGTTSPQ